MSNDTAPQHSGSRWEHATTTDPVTSRTTITPTLWSSPASARPGADRGRRRRRGPVLAVLAAALTLGASAAGIAYVHPAQEPATTDPAAVADGPEDPGPGVGDRDGDERRGDHLHQGDRGVDGPGSRDDDDAAAGDSGELPS